MTKFLASHRCKYYASSS